MPGSDVLPLLRGGNIQDGAVTLDDLIYVNRSCVSREQLLRKHDIVLTMSSGSAALVGKSAWVGEPRGALTFGAFCACLRTHQPLQARWLFWFLQTPFYRQSITGSAKGTSINNLKRDHLGHLPVPVPSDAELPKLTARIDTLFAEIDEGEAALAEARAGVETYRKALLKAAVTGELTADWRQANPPQETGEQLLQRILTDRRARWQAEPKNASKSYKEPTGPDTDGLPALPEGWTWASLGQLLSGIEAGLNVKAHGRPPANGETGIVKVSAVTWDEFDEEQSKALFPDAEIDERDFIAAGDFLISRANTLELVGAPAIVRHLSKRLVLSDKILRLVVPADCKDWLYFVLKSPFGRQHIEARSTGNQLSMRNISQDGLRALPIPLPPTTELSLVLTKVGTGWHEHQRLSEWLEENNAASALRQSILAAAFRGELTA